MYIKKLSLDFVGEMVLRPLVYFMFFMCTSDQLPFPVALGFKTLLWSTHYLLTLNVSLQQANGKLTVLICTMCGGDHGTLREQALPKTCSFLSTGECQHSRNISERGLFSQEWKHTRSGLGPHEAVRSLPSRHSGRKWLCERCHSMLIRSRMPFVQW
jgi:hypothetical protein